MLQVLQRIFDSREYMPHGHCFLWEPGLVWLHVVTDSLIGTAYVAISWTLYQLVRRIRLPFSPMILAFGTFIGACGLTHYMEVFTLWVPDYWLSGAVKAVTAIASVATGIYLFEARPAIVEVTRSAQLAEERRLRLESTHGELERLYRRVKELDEAKTQLFANVSHELRTPLALILGPVEKLLATDLPDDAHRDLEVVRRNARILLRHVNDFLDVARLEEGKVTASYARIDLARLVRASAETFEALARERRITLAVEGPETLAAEVDPEKAQRVLLNLLGNAFKFAPDGGRVRCAFRAEGGRAILTVEDNGPGIVPEMREAIFERFRQEEGRGARRFGGAGLGLAIARDFVEMHRGAIRAGEPPSGGALFTVELPLSAPAGTEVSRRSDGGFSAEAARAAVEEQRAPPPTAAVTQAGPEAPLALVVEDDPEMSRFVAGSVAADFRIATASDGDEGLEKAEALRPDVVVTDIMMPRVAGDRLIRELRSRPALAETPTIVLTARADDALRLRLLREGADDYVVKPFSAEELCARATNLARLKRARDVLRRELDTAAGDVEALARELAVRKRELEVSLDSTQIAREQAERASAVKSVFLGMVSHELRTPLTSIQLSIQTLLRGSETPLTVRQHQVVTRIAEGARRLLDLVESLLEYTRVESGRLVVRPEPFDLAGLAAEAVDEVLPQAQQKLLELSLAPSPQPLVVTSDPRLVRLVLMNLIVNAVKYTDHGSVGVMVGSDASGAWFEVKDTGPGIADAERERIFEPFERLGDPTHKPTPGVGIGLSLVRGIVEALEAELQLTSEPGSGSSFRVRLAAT